MTPLRCAALATSLVLADAALNSPVNQVVTLLEDLRSQVEQDGTDEAAAYDEFACFCKDQTTEKSAAILATQDAIREASATVEQKVARGADKATSVEARRKDKETYAADLQDTIVRCSAQHATYEESAADFSKAISSLEHAISRLEQSKPKESFVELKGSVEETLELGQTMGLITPTKRQSAVALLQGRQDPSEDSEYGFHSQHLIDLLLELKEDFKSQKGKMDTEWGKTENSCNQLKSSISNEMESNADAISTLEGEIEELKSDAAAAREEVSNSENSMKDDQVYLKDLTTKCETRARDWDQRSSMRADEVKALTQALTMLTDKVQALDEEVNERALLQTPAASAVHRRLVSRVVSARQSEGRAKSPSFIQTHSAASRARTFLERSHDFSPEARKDRVATILRSEGQRLGSTALALMAQRAQADPFKKVKQLIQNLVERLLAEHTAEATKKGFCDTELGKARKERDMRKTNVEKLAAQLGALTSRKDALAAKIEDTSAEHVEVTEALGEAFKLRQAEKAENVDTVQKAKEGAEAVGEALLILRSFYKRAAAGGAAALLQASPSAGVIGMLEVIKSDFQRTAKQAEQAEKVAAASFIEFDRTSKMDIAAKETTVELDKAERVSTANQIHKKMGDLETEQKLLDDCLKGLEDLKPVCLDTGMSYGERVEKREEEIDALKSALCVLDPEKVEEECQGGK